MKTFLHKKIRAFFLFVMLLLSSFTFLGSTPAKNKVLVDSASNSPSLDIVSRTTRNLPTTVPNNFNLNWENKHFQKNAFRIFLQRLSEKNDKSETLSPMGLKKIVSFFQIIISDFQASAKQKIKEIQLKLFENDFDKETKFSRIIIWFMELYYQAQKADMSATDNVNFNPQEKKDYLLEALKTLINLEEIYLEIKSLSELSDCKLVPILKIDCISITVAFKPNAKEKAINYQTFINVLYSISKWIYIRLKDELAWNLNSDGTLDLNWEKNALLHTKLVKNPFLSQILKKELMNILLEKINFQFYNSKEKTFSKNYLLKFIGEYLKKKSSLLSYLFSDGALEKMIKNSIVKETGNLDKVAYNILKNFIEVTSILREVFIKNTTVERQKFQIKIFFTVVRKFLQEKNKNELKDKNIKILIGQILNIILKFNEKMSAIWNPQSKIKAEIQNLLNDYAQPFYSHLQNITKTYQEYIWEPSKKLAFSGIIRPYIGNKSAEDNEILTIQWTSNDKQKYTIAVHKQKDRWSFNVLYFAPNHWINPLQESLQSYIKEL